MKTLEPFNTVVGENADLRGWAGEAGLVRLALEAVQTVDLTRPGMPPTMPVPAMLTLLSYCYASGIYGSQDIELAAQSDGMIRYICAGTCPDAQWVRNFRRLNRISVCRCLAYVLAHAGQHAMPDESAEARINLAVLTDAAASDW